VVVDMSREEMRYNNIVLRKVERKFDVVFPFAAFACFGTAFLITFSTIPRIFAYINIVMGIILMLMFFLRKKITIKFKITLTILLGLFIGVTAFLDGGYTSSFIAIFAIVNIIAVLFMSRKYSFNMSLISISLFLLLWVYNEMYMQEHVFYLSADRFAMQFIVFCLYLVFLNVAVYTIKSSLNDNILKLEKTLNEVHDLAYFDSLTGLPNQNHFRDELDKIKPTEGAIILINIKSLNIVNSIYGEHIGDQVLIYFANLLQDFVCDKGTIARHAGNEFAIYCLEKDEATVDYKLNRFLHYFNHEYIHDVVDMMIQFHISFAFIEEGINYQDSYNNAKIALTYVKKNQLNTFMPYNQELIEYIKIEELVRAKIEPAIENEEIIPHYQTKIDVSTNEVQGVEALARWYQIDIGNIPPDTFIPLIEKMGLSVQFGDYMMNRVLHDYNELKESFGKDIQISINISPSHLISSKFCDKVESLKQVYAIPDGKIILEITEEVMIEDIDRVRSIINELHTIGVLISLDDFGSGYSSINYLATLDIDELKIDRVFIEQLHTNPKSIIIVESLVDIASKYNVILVAEGVETSEQVNILKGIGCEIIQGYYFSKPAKL
jgi:diguanylate cyclase (GGDEF)-like protein